MKLTQLEIDVLTEPFPITLGDVLDLPLNDFDQSKVEAKKNSIKILKRFYELGIIQFEVWLYYSNKNKIEIIFGEAEKGFVLKVDNLFWSRLESEDEIWNRVTKDMKRSWDIGIDFTEKFKKKYFEKDDSKFRKLIEE